MKKETKECPSCAMEIQASSKECPICGYEFPSTNLMFRVIAVLLIVLFIYMMLR